MTGQAPPVALTGWGRTSPTLARVAAPAGLDDLGALLAASPRGVLARGLGRSYGDAAQNAGGVVVDVAGLGGTKSVLDPTAASVTTGAAVSLDELMRRHVPQGWFPVVTPGTRAVTVGGAIACDIHGKNHHGAGTFGAHVGELDLVTADGEVLTVSPTADPLAFWATVGGMGLTGVVTRATVGMLPVETAWMSVDTTRIGHLDAVMAAMVEADRTADYSVAWIDIVPGGSSFGRGVLTTGRHAALADLDGRRAADPLHFDPPARARVPIVPPLNLLSRPAIAAFNEAWFRKAPRERHGELQHMATYFHPLDGVRDWNRVYGPKGFVQYQVVVPDSASGIVADVLMALQGIGASSFVSVLKRFGAANPAPLSFPRPGWTLALDVPAGIHGLGPVLDALDEQVAAAGGAVYLAKDSRMRPELLAAMYPRLDEWRAERDRLDPHRQLRSDLARRLSL